MSVFSNGIKGLLAAALLSMVAAQISAATHTLFYTVAHQDDWQLFMNPNAFHDTHQVPDSKVVFIYLTAGDAGYRTSPVPGHIVPYFRAREIGANEAVRLMATPSRINCEGCIDEYGQRLRSRWVHISDRWWYRVVRYRNTVSYFLRLPDGNANGGGYIKDAEGIPRVVSVDDPASSGSLLRLWNGGPAWEGYPELTDVQDRYSYTAEELITALEGIIREEAAGSSNVWVNIPYKHATPGYVIGGSPDHDHADHIYSGWFMFQAAKAFSCVNRAEFYGYQTSVMEPNLSLEQTIWEAAVWGATNSGLIRTDGARTTFNDPHNAWLGRNYFYAYPGAGSLHTRYLLRPRRPAGPLME